MSERIAFVQLTAENGALYRVGVSRIASYRPAAASKGTLLAIAGHNLPLLVQETTDQIDALLRLAGAAVQKPPVSASNGKPPAARGKESPQ